MQDVGNAFVVALKRDVNGACYGVFPDCPLMDFPNSNTPLFYAYALLGQKLFQRMGLEVIGPIHLGIVAVFMLLLVLCLGKLIGIL